MAKGNKKKGNKTHNYSDDDNFSQNNNNKNNNNHNIDEDDDEIVEVYSGIKSKQQQLSSQQKQKQKQQQQQHNDNLNMDSLKVATPNYYESLSADDDNDYDNEEDEKVVNKNNGGSNNISKNNSDYEDDNSPQSFDSDSDCDTNTRHNNNSNNNIKNKQQPPQQQQHQQQKIQQKVNWLSKNEIISTKKSGVYHKFKMGIMYVTNQRVVWNSEDEEDDDDDLVTIDIHKIVHQLVTPSQTQQTWKVKTPQSDYLFIFPEPFTKENLAEIINCYKQSHQQLSSQRQQPPSQIQQQQQQQHNNNNSNRISPNSQSPVLSPPPPLQQPQYHQPQRQQQQFQPSPQQLQQQQQQQQQQQPFYPKIIDHDIDEDDSEGEDENMKQQQLNRQRQQLQQQQQQQQMLQAQQQAQQLQQQQLQQQQLQQQQLQQQQLQQQQLQAQQLQQKQAQAQRQAQQQQQQINNNNIKSVNNEDNFYKNVQIPTTQPQQQQSPQQSIKSKKSNEDDGDFFNVPINMVGDDGDSRWEEESNGVELSGYYNLEVRDPRTHSDENGVYVSYEILGKYKDETQQSNSVITRRRYREFEWLHSQLSLPSNHHSRIPSLPQKSIYQYWNNTDVSLLRQRCSALDQFMKSISVTASLRNHSAVKMFMSSKSIPVNVNTITEIISSNLLSPNALTNFTNAVITGGGSIVANNNNYLDSIDPNFAHESSVERDYWISRKLMSKWKRIPKRLPFSKFLVVVLGTVSAGKSSFINNFYNLQVKVSADEQLDTHFTLIETIPKEQFYELSDQTVAKKFTREQLSQKIKGEAVSDPRHGHVFLYLDKTYTLSRYDAQFSNYRDIISNLNLVRTVLINEEYLTGATPDEILNQKKTIFIDSPGFEPKTEHDPEKMLGSIRVVQFFQSTSDLTLFMMKAKELALVSSQIQIVELCVLYKTYGPEIVDHMVTQMFNKKAESKSFFSLFEMVKGLVEQIRLKNIPKTQDSNGTSVWDGIKFVMTQIDTIDSNLKEQYFELGRLLGKGLMFLDPPTFRQCKAIALPMDRQFTNAADRREKCGDLDELLSYIYNLNRGSTYNSRLESAIEEMTTDLLCNIQKSWTNYLFNSDYNLVLQLKDRSKHRVSGPLHSHSSRR